MESESRRNFVKKLGAAAAGVTTLEHPGTTLAKTREQKLTAEEYGDKLMQLTAQRVTEPTSGGEVVVAAIVKCVGDGEEIRCGYKLLGPTEMIPGMEFEPGSV